jgi:hypothetical protein
VQQLEPAMKDWYDDTDGADDPGFTEVDLAGHAGAFDTIEPVDDVCDATLSLTDPRGVAYLIACEEDDAHDEHSGTVRWKAKEDPYAAEVAAQLDRLQVLHAARRELWVSWRMPRRAWDVLPIVAPLAVDEDATQFMGLPVVFDESLDAVELVCDTP